MKKNLFILFSFYFFVLQPILLGFFWSESNFFWISLINFGFLILISLFTGKDDKEESKSKSSNDESDNHKKKRTKKMDINIHHAWFFVISILAGFFVWFWLGDLVLHLSVLSSVVVSFVLFILFGILFGYKALKVWGSKIYIIALILSLLWSIFMMLNIDFDKDNTLEENQEIETGTNFVPVDADLELENGLTIQEDLSKEASFEDAIKHILDVNDISLVENKNIKFSYIGYNDIDYRYYRTAYSLGMIGKNLNPDKNLFCETYVVMDGLAKGWDIDGYSDIKKAYWDYAQKNDLLPDCEYGEYIKIGDFR
ncbi:MAG TPA: hypothetical protein P5060_03730 [Candidatus Absconditabacterales bacterium]|nr:hypothetical protein [Candidatus Absconditabacterales bacterium]